MERRHGRREETAALLVGWVRSCFRGGCHSGRAASAVARTCLPHAASGDVGAVHHDTSLDARPLVDRIVVFLWSTSRQRQPWAEVPVHSGHGARERAIEHSITTERHGSGLRSAFGQCDCRITSLAPIKVWALNSAIVRHYHQATDLRRQRHQGIFRGPVSLRSRTSMRWRPRSPRTCAMATFAPRECPTVAPAEWAALRP